MGRRRQRACCSFKDGSTWNASTTCSEVNPSAPSTQNGPPPGSPSFSTMPQTLKGRTSFDCRKCRLLRQRLRGKIAREGDVKFVLTKADHLCPFFLSDFPFVQVLLKTEDLFLQGEKVTAQHFLI